MEIVPDVEIVLKKSDLKKVDKAISAVAAELNVRPTKVVFSGDKIRVCYRPWYEKVFREALNETS